MSCVVNAERNTRNPRNFFLTHLTFVEEQNTLFDPSFSKQQLYNLSRRVCITEAWKVHQQHFLFQPFSNGISHHCLACEQKHRECKAVNARSDLMRFLHTCATRSVKQDHTSTTVCDLFVDLKRAISILDRVKVEGSFTNAVFRLLRKNDII